MRILPNQEPFNVWVGWVTPDFHQNDMPFDSDDNLTVTVTLGDDSGKVQERFVFFAANFPNAVTFNQWAAMFTVFPFQSNLASGCLVITALSSPTA